MSKGFTRATSIRRLSSASATVRSGSGTRPSSPTLRSPCPGAPPSAAPDLTASSSPAGDVMQVIDQMEREGRLVRQDEVLALPGS